MNKQINNLIIFFNCVNQLLGQSFTKYNIKRENELK